jgi:hypothetical protein
MLRFEVQPPPSKRSFASGGRRGVWMLLLMLGLVIMLMRQLERPEAAALLGRVFSDPPDAAAPRGGADDEAATPIKPAVERRAAPWSAVVDHSSHRTAERDAWFSLFETVQTTPPDDLAARSVGEATYAQLVAQPDVYRAHVVRIRGRVLAEYVKRAPENKLGIDEYHQVFIAPRGGGEWPIVVYALELPEGFPRGADLDVPITQEALFFKSWSFSDGEKVGLAPVLVARTIDWRPAAAAGPAPRRTADRRGLAIGVGAAAIVAGAFVWWAMAHTRRRASLAADRPVDLSGLEAES